MRTARDGRDLMLSDSSLTVLPGGRIAALALVLLAAILLAGSPRAQESGAPTQNAVDEAIDPEALPNAEGLGQDNVEVEAGTEVEDSGAPGHITSQALGRIPEGLPIEVAVYDDRDENLQVREEVSLAIERQGYVVASGAPLELLLETRTLQPEFKEAKPSLGQIRAGTENEVGNQGSRRGVEAEVNIWSSSKDSILGGRKSQDSSSGEPRYLIAAQLRDRESGKVLWKADVTCEMLSRDRERLIRSMAGPLAESLGETVNARPFEIR